MSRASRALLLAATFAVLFGSPAWSANWATDWDGSDVPGWHGNVNLLLGSRDVDDNGWDSIDEQRCLGLGLDLRRESWPVSLAAELSYAEASERAVLPVNGGGAVSVEVKGETLELDVGVVKIWDRIPVVRPFLGAGVAAIRARKSRTGAVGQGAAATDLETGRAQATSLGPWVSGGVYWAPEQHFNVGLGLKWTKASANLFGARVETGGRSLSLLAGYHW